MARRARTASQVNALDKDGVHWIAPGLYMQIRLGQGTPSYLFRWGRDGENQWLGLGSVADKSLSDARDEAAAVVGARGPSHDFGCDVCEEQPM